MRRSPIRRSDEEERAIQALIDEYDRAADDGARAGTVQAAQAPGRCRAHAADQDHQGGDREQAHRDRQDRVGAGQAGRPAPQRAHRRGLADLSRLVRAGDGRWRTAARGQADALPVPPGWQARILRRQVPRHLQRAARQPGRLLEGTVRRLARRHGRRTRSSRTSAGTRWRGASWRPAKKRRT